MVSLPSLPVTRLRQGGVAFPHSSTQKHQTLPKPHCIIYPFITTTSILPHLAIPKSWLGTGTSTSLLSTGLKRCVTIENRCRKNTSKHQSLYTHKRPISQTNARAHAHSCLFSMLLLRFWVFLLLQFCTLICSTSFPLGICTMAHLVTGCPKAQRGTASVRPCFCWSMSWKGDDAKGSRCPLAMRPFPLGNDWNQQSLDLRKRFSDQMLHCFRFGWKEHAKSNCEPNVHGACLLGPVVKHIIYTQTHTYISYLLHDCVIRSSTLLRMLPESSDLNLELQLISIYITGTYISICRKSKNQI